MEGKGVTLITNGTQGTPTRHDDFIKIGVSLFELPVHSSDPAVHDYMAGVPGSWQKAVDSVKYLRKAGANTVAVIVLTRFNIAGVGETMDFIAGLGVERIMINRYNIVEEYGIA